MTFTAHSSHPRPLSRWLILVAGTVFTAGVSAGWLLYEHTPAARARRIPGTNAWWQQAAVALVTVVILGVAWRRRRRGQAGPRWMLAPLSQAAAARIGLLRRPASAWRALAAAPLGLAFLYGFFRAGLQVLSGLNPNNTVNAWGGPGYAGAMACHYLDLFLIMMVAAWLLDRVLPRVPASAAAMFAVSVSSPRR
jgi:hypothetical protein